MLAPLEHATQDEHLDNTYRPTDINDVSAGQFRKEIHGKLQLLDATRWDPDDATLVPKAGACSACTKRSDCQPLLFDEDDLAGNDKAKKGDRCLDEKCYTGKLIAWLKVRRVELAAEHSGLRFVSAAPWSMSKALKGVTQGSKVLGRYEVTFLKKSNPRAVPAMWVDGANAGKVVYCAPDRRETSSGRSSSRASSKPGKPTPLKKRRADLNRRRLAHVVDAVRTQLEAWNAGHYEKWFQDATDVYDEPALVVVALAVVFGTNGNLSGIHRGPADPFKAAKALWMREGKGEEKGRMLIGKMMHSVSRVWISRLTIAGALAHASIELRYEDAGEICQIVGIDFDGLKRDADAALPDPKSWARLNADGTPKAAPAKKAKAGTKTKTPGNASKKTKPGRKKRKAS